MVPTLEGNKILAAILTAGIIASASGVLSRILYSPQHLEEPAFKVAVEEGGAAADAAQQEEEKPLAALLASASAEEGAKVARKCAACHTFNEGGANRIGPNLWDLVNRPIGAHGDYSYSPAMAGHGGNWDYEALDHFLENPKGFVPGTKMSFAGLPKHEERADLLAYLRTLSADPAPLPES